MEAQVFITSPAAHFNFDSASASPFVTAPSSPHGIHSFYNSAPTSPSFYRHADAVPFGWEEKPAGMPKSLLNSSAASFNYRDADGDLDDGGGKEFAFDFSGHLDREPMPADELFYEGQIKPMKPPPWVQCDRDPGNTQRSPRSPGKFLAGMEQTRREGTDERKRGRSKKSSRSLSPFRVSDLLFEPDTAQESERSPPTGFASFWHRKWRIKDLLLFRSASEGRAKDMPLIRNRRDDVTKDSSLRSTESAASSSSRRRSGPAVSAHELHYTVNRQLSEEMRKKTFLPYKQGLLGCLGFLPAAARDHFPARGIISPAGSLPRV